MKLLSLLLTAILCATASAQTIKTLGYNATNGQIIANTGTNVLTFNDNVKFDGGITTGDAFAYGFETLPNTAIQIGDDGIDFNTINAAATTRANLGFSTNLNTLWTATNASNARSAVGLGATWLTNTNVTNFRSAIGLGATNIVELGGLTVNGQFEMLDGQTFYVDGEIGINAVFTFSSDIRFSESSVAATTRTNLGLPLAALTNTSNVTMMRALAGSTNTNEPYSGTVALTNTNVLTFSNGVLLKIQ